MARPYAAAQYVETAAEVSPDGRFAAYEASETGQSEIYVREFPDPLGKWRISAGGGVEPNWSKDGRYLYYVGADRQSVVRTGIQEGASPAPLRTETVWRVPGLAGWDLDRDSGRALVLVDEDAQGGSNEYTVSVVVNWFEELRRLTGEGN